MTDALRARSAGPEIRLCGAACACPQAHRPGGFRPPTDRTGTLDAVHRRHASQRLHVSAWIAGAGSRQPQPAGMGSHVSATGAGARRGRSGFAGTQGRRVPLVFRRLVPQADGVYPLTEATAERMHRMAAGRTRYRQRHEARPAEPWLDIGRESDRFRAYCSRCAATCSDIRWGSCRSGGSSSSSISPYRR